MVHRLMELIGASSRRTPHRRGKASDRRAHLVLEQLEHRVIPIVGAYAIPGGIAAGAGYDGVVQVGGVCTGALLPTGRHVLTAAHCPDGNLDGIEDTETMTVTFDLPGGPITMTSTSITDHPNWNGKWNSGWDFAVLELPAIAPVRAERYDIYRSSDEVGKVFTVVGYGATGTGRTGHDGSYGVKRLGSNRFDRADGATARLFFDFDSRDCITVLWFCYYCGVNFDFLGTDASVLFERCRR